MSARMSAERLAEIRREVNTGLDVIRKTGNFMGPQYIKGIGLSHELLAELDAVTREREEWEQVARTNFADYQAANDTITTLTRALAEARRDSARLDWMQEHDAYVNVSDDEVASCYVQSNRDYLKCGHSVEYDIRAAIDAAMSSDSAASNEGGKPEEYVPGSWICPRCSYVEVKGVLSVGDGSYAPSREPALPCPNDGEFMRPLTRREVREVLDA